MCNPTDVEEPAKGKTEAETETEAFNTEKSARRKPQNGKDLGVWEISLEDRSNMLSLWTLGYLSPLLRLGAFKLLEQDDVGVPSKVDLADTAYDVILRAWAEQVEKCAAFNTEKTKLYDASVARCNNDEQRTKVKKPTLREPSMATALLKGFGTWKIVFAIALYVVSALLGFVPVLILNDLVKFFESGGNSSDYHGIAPPWVEVVALGFIPFIISLLQTRNQVIMAHCSVFVRTGVSTLLYQKSLCVSAGGRAKTSTGQIVNLMSNDTTQLQRFLQFSGMIVVAPLQIIIALVLIYGQVGNATWVGVGFMVFLAPINVVIFSIVSKMRRKVLKYSDLRVKMMNEILNGIRIIKFYGWEKAFGKEVGKLRRKELDALTNLAYVSAVGFSLILLSAPIIQPILVFVTYVNIQSTPLDAATAFTTVALFNIMRFPFAFLPMGLLQYIQSKISLRRIELFLQLPELDEYVVNDTDNEPGSIAITNGTFSWLNPDGPEIRPIQDDRKKPPKKKKEDRRGSKSLVDTSADASMRNTQHSQTGSVDTEGHPRAPVITLKDITTTITPGSLVAIVGPVGSGKSSFLSAILGEMEPIKSSKVILPIGNSDRAGFLSYCAQTPWVVNATLKDNILFGREMVQERYDQIVEACALLDDLAVLPAGDMTEIGERGINLSGGQKARVALARALYSPKTKVVLMDDPLSAVDAHVGEHLFASAITGDVIKGATRVLVTHHVHFLPRCDKVIVMEGGRIKHQGRFEDLVAQGIDFAGAVDCSKVETAEDASLPESPALIGLAEKEELKEDTVLEVKAKADLKEKGKSLVKAEEREEGSVDSGAYIHYAKSGGWWVAISAVFVQGLGRAAEVMAAFWLSIWAGSAVSALQSGHPHTDAETSRYVGIYAAFGMIGVFGLTVRALLMAVHRLHASKTLHENLTGSILRAPVAFFDVTPSGRILNRFAADMDKIDQQITQSLGQGFSTIFSVLGAVGAIIAATKGTFLIPLIPIGYIYWMIQRWFRNTSTELQRINSIANSPIFADFSQTLSGTSTIRAYGEQNRFFVHCKQSFDNMNSSYILVQLCSYWLGLRLDILGGLIAAFIGGLAVATSSTGFIPAGWLGLALSYAIEVTGFLKFGVRMIATIEADMNSVERVLFYSRNIESEAPSEIPGKDPERGTWPTSGEIEIRNASMRYRDGPLVLKDISLTVKGGEKIGVVGRTGSGKSSLMIVLFRISEIEKDGGKILIDGVDTGAIGTGALRLNLSIIPQEPVMFSNSVRYNLDPFAEASDEQLWEVLKKVELGEVIASLPGGLDEQVSEGGENFSQGQRQLLCIARSLLRNPKVLVLDEATASIDNTTDALIQKMIRKNFGNATVLTIAHRLNTIMDSDRILVLDDGRIVEFDTPGALLGKKDGYFKAMMNKSQQAHEM